MLTYYLRALFLGFYCERGPVNLMRLERMVCCCMGEAKKPRPCWAFLLAITAYMCALKPTVKTDSLAGLSAEA